jgi:putative PIN family toxin of toxin-antitoxin system
MPTLKPGRIVLDTNIVLDLLHFNDRHSAPLKAAIADGRLQCYSDADCLAELERVTGYPEFALEASARQKLVNDYRRFVTLCPPADDENFVLPRCRDADDQKFLIVAARCHADLLLTRDKLLLRLDRHRHKPPPFSIMSAAAAVRLLGLS